MPTESVEPQPSTTKKVVFSLILLTLVAVTLEVGASIYLKVTRGYDGEHLLQYQFDPYKNIQPTPNFVDTRGIRHNSAGFRRSTEVTPEKPANTFRIFLMGASTAYGTGGMWPHLQREYEVLDNSTTIDAYLERMLAEALPGMNVEVINAGIPSAWTHHELIYLDQKILGYEPDMLLMLDGYNDFFFFDETHDQFARYAYGEQAHTIMGEPTFRSLLAANGWWFFRKSALIHALGRGGRELALLLRGTPEQQPIDVDRALAAVERTFGDNALRMVRHTTLIARDEGIPTVFMLQPLLILERGRPGMEEMEKALLEFNVESTLPNYEQYMREAVPMISEMTREAVSETGAEYIDLTGIFREARGQIFTDYAHLTPEGNEILAGEVFDRILPMIKAEIGHIKPIAPDETT